MCTSQYVQILVCTHALAAPEQQKHLFTWPVCYHGDHEPDGFVHPRQVERCFAICHISRFTSFSHITEILAFLFNLVINPLFLSCAFSLSPGVERPWRPCHHLSPVLWKSHSERLRWQHTQSVVCCYWKGELLSIYVFI